MNRIALLTGPLALMLWISHAVTAACQEPPADHTHEHDDHDHHHPVAAAKKADVYAPTVIPDRITLTWTGDPATTQAVTWRTATEVTQGTAELAIATGNPNFTQSARVTLATTQKLKTDLSTAHFHTVEWTELKPETKYAYRVGDGTNWSEWFHFTTASTGAAPFSFIYFGDAQNNIRSMWSRVIREAYSDAPKASFFLHAGDLVNRAESDAEWGEWFTAGSHLNAMVPSVAVPGNHEQARSAFGARRLSNHWRPTFAFPLNGPEGLKESCYTFVYQGVRIVALNSNEQLAKQAEWLDDVLENNTERWTVCTFHHPVFSTGGDRDNPELRRLWKPILDKHLVDLVLQGHDHTYGRTGLETPVTGKTLSAVANTDSGVSGKDPSTGTVYVVSVSGPKMYKLQRHEFMTKQLANTQLYQIIHIDGDELRYEARTAVGDVYDTFTLKKRSGKINELIEPSE